MKGNIKENVKERPILFSTPMVRANREKRKSETRRITKALEQINENPDEWDLIDSYEKNGALHFGFNHCNTAQVLGIKCPYGVVGDWLWVRETWREDAGDFHYKADCEYDAQKATRWRPSIHMPRCASRDKYQILELSIERLHNLTDESAIKEGVEISKCSELVIRYKNYLSKNEGSYSMPSYSYRTLWESINGANSWDANPWVWVIKYKND